MEFFPFLISKLEMNQIVSAFFPLSFLSDNGSGTEKVLKILCISLLIVYSYVCSGNNYKKIIEENAQVP